MRREGTLPRRRGPLPLAVQRSAYLPCPRSQLRGLLGEVERPEEGVGRSDWKRLSEENDRQRAGLLCPHATFFGTEPRHRR